MCRGNTTWFGYEPVLDKENLVPSSRESGDFKLRFNSNDNYLIEFDDTEIFSRVNTRDHSYSGFKEHSGQYHEYTEEGKTEPKRMLKGSEVIIAHKVKAPAILDEFLHIREQIANPLMTNRRW